jgi:hypothetical protein
MKRSFLAQGREHIKIHPYGTPRRKHVVTNTIIQIEGKASTRLLFARISGSRKLPNCMGALLRRNQFSRHATAPRWDSRDGGHRLKSGPPVTIRLVLTIDAYNPTHPRRSPAAVAEQMS